MAIIKDKKARTDIATEIRRYFDSISDLLLGRDELVKSEKEIFTREVINELEYIRRNVYEIFLYCSSDDRYEHPEDKEELKVWFNIIKETQEKIKEVIGTTKQKELVCAIILQGTEKLSTSSRMGELGNFHTQFTISERRKKKGTKDDSEGNEESAILFYATMLDYEFLNMYKEDIISAAFPEFKLEIMSNTWRENDKGNTQAIQNLIYRMHDASTYSSLLDSMLLLIQSEISLIFKNPNIDFSRIYMAEEPTQEESYVEDEEDGVETAGDTQEGPTEDDEAEEAELGVKKSKENAVPDDLLKGLLNNFNFGSGLIRDNEDITLEGDQFKLYDKYINYLRDNFFKSGEKDGQTKI